MTHPFHPWHGREFELLDRRRAWGEDRVYFYDQGGALRRMPAEWTSAGTENLFVQVSAGRSYFRVADLLKLADLLERVVEASHRADVATERRNVSRE